MQTGLIKGTAVLAKIMEVIHWVLCVALLVGVVLFAVKDWVPTVSGIEPGATANIMGYSVQVVSDDGILIDAAVYNVLIGGIIVAALTAMVFRDIYLICRFTQGASVHAKGAVPFQPDNVRMVREIGIFSIAIPVVQLICSVVARLTVGADLEVVSFTYMGIVFGVAMLCLSQVFAYGMQLQRDADGLI